MITDKIKVSSDGTGREEALKEVEKFSNYMELEEKQELRLRLLAEEALGIVSAIAGYFNADFWLDEETEECRIHLLAKTEMDSGKKEEFIKVSSSGKNEAAKGIMGKIRDIFENSIYNVNEVEQLACEYDGGAMMFASLGNHSADAANFNSLVYKWSLNRYRANLSVERDTNPAAEEAWDELEKSIVANLADDVKVSVAGQNVELTIEKKF